ncbi:hypothetical protein M0G74_14595 [Microbulbifer sp. CAU 1566]|uniref:hypothetical protein n=1 Tax=Microbulbifer sp. CAU 1566 TaxID=2933269 RepID=UPI0020038F9F|nr:hypothetical protein [Microbulbifer sp. CAU 1566]MCK7598507.1 hypothetical protein [Microbulbifer sp. CAU 1566]
MSVGAWEPANQASNDQSRKEIDQSLLQQIMHAMEAVGAKAEAATDPDLGAPDLTGFEASLRNANWLAGLAANQWLEEAAHWEDAQIWSLIRFFTLAEMQLPDWQGGAESPVIPLAKALRQRKAPLARAQLLWLREHSDNRYLPYGPL